MKKIIHKNLIECSFKKLNITNNIYMNDHVNFIFFFPCFPKKSRRLEFFSIKKIKMTIDVALGNVS